MRYLIIFIICLGMWGAEINSNTNFTSKQISSQSVLYDKWFKHFGQADFKKNFEANNSVANKEYAFQTNWTILDMIAQDDILGLKCIYQKLETDLEHNIAFFNGIASPSISFEQQAIDKISINAFEFLLKNKIIDTKAIIRDEKTQKELSLCEYIVQKIKQSKIKKEIKIATNYEKMLKILEEYIQ